MKIQVLPTRRRHDRPVDLARVPGRPPKQHKIVSFALSGRQLNWLRETQRALAARKVSQSAIVRAAIDCLAERSAGGTPDDLAQYIAYCAQDARDLMTSSSSEESRE